MTPTVLFDTSALMRLLVEDDGHGRVEARLVELVAAGEQVGVLVHTLRECWAVLTKSERANGYDVETDEARRRLTRLTDVFLLAPDPPGVYDRWLDLCDRTATKSVMCHDAYLAASALVMDVRVYTFDRDFARFGVRLA